MRTMAISTAALAMFALAIGVAHANCARDVADAKTKVEQIKDGKTREQAASYLQRAGRELDENDEFECESAIEAIDKLAKPPAPR